ncbi:DUF6876 family protein [Bradyrhizobium sp. SZCCHNS2005]|uniref:DUF6876 family protein n=1 Tax=Bradyrhizobium sp. SZCCHNS2005 TaxID=3057303 RepID=UPI0039648BCD
MTFNFEDLREFTGSEYLYRHALNHDVLYTDGAKPVADSAGTYCCRTRSLSPSAMSARCARKPFRFGDWR